MDEFEIRDDVELEDLTDEERGALVELARRVVEEGKAIREALGIGGEYVETMEYYAHQLYQNGKLEEAGVLLEGVLALDEARYYPYLLVGDIAMQEERWEEAAKCLQAAAEFGPDSSLVEGKLGEALLRVGRIEAAVGRLRRAIACADEDDDKYKRRSEVLLSLVDRGAEEPA